MMAVKRRKFSIIFWYFKPSGKLCAEGTTEMEATDCSSDDHPICYMSGIVDELKGWLQNRRLLPGLLGSWEGPIVVNCEQGYPVLINGRQSGS